MALPFAAFGWRTANVQRYRQDLYQAVESRDHAKMILAIRNGARWKIPDQYGETVLHMAVKKRCDEPHEQKEAIKILEWFLKQKKLKVDVKCRAGKTALHIAVRNGMPDVVDYLIGQGADLNARDERGNSMAHYMVEGEYERYFQYCKTASSADELRPYHRESVNFFDRMLAKKIRVDCMNKNRDTPLQMAVKRNLLHLLPIMLEFTQDVKFRDKERKTVLHLFIETFKNSNHSDVPKYSKSISISTSYYDRALVIDVLKMMLIKGYSVAAVDHQGNTPLHIAAHLDWPEIIEIMLKDFKKVNICNDDDNTILHIIIDNCIDQINRQHKKDCVKIVRALLSKGAYIDKPNKNGYTPLQLAVMRTHPTILQIFKDHGANLKQPYNGQGNLLHLLSQKSSKIIDSSKLEDVIGLLVSQGCDVNARDSDGMTPMHLAAQSRRNAVIAGLTKCHANVDARELSFRRFTPLQMAVNNNCDYSIDRLVNVGADINAKDSSGKTALHLAMNYKTGMVKTLLRLGAHVDIEDDEELLPLHYAIRKQNGVALAELLKYGADINDIGTYRELVSLAGPGYVLFCILEHWIKMKAAGLPVAPAYRAQVSDDTFHELYRECLKEVEDLRSYEIGDRTSLYDLFHMDWSFRCAYTVNKSFKDLIESAVLQKRFPKYHVLILASYHDAAARQPMLEPAKRAWCEFTKITLPDVCVYRILAHLNNRELRMMIDGLKDRSFRKPCNLLLNMKGRGFK